MEHIYWVFTSLLLIADLAIRIGLSLRVIMRKRAASVSLAWLVVILLLPFAGASIYLMFGENRLGENRAKRAAANVDFLGRWADALKKKSIVDWERINPECVPIHNLIDSIFKIPAMQDNDLQLIDSSDRFFDNLLQDIDAAASFCYLQFYIMCQGGYVDKVVDASELLGQFEFSCNPIEVAVHTPCTLQHGQGISGGIERILERAGITIVESSESHLCCGSAGTYSIMQPELSRRLLIRKLTA